MTKTHAFSVAPDEHAKKIESKDFTTDQKKSEDKTDSSKSE